MFGRKREKLLSVLIGEKTITLCHSAPDAGNTAGGGIRSQSVAVDLPETFTWERPGDLAAQIKTALRNAKISARRAAVGLPGRWVMFKPMQLPPTDPASAAAILRLAIEREYQGDAREWVFDYVGTPSPKEKSPVLLAATPRAKLAHVLAVLQQAGVQVEVVTSATVELSARIPGLTLCQFSDGVEFAATNPRGPLLIERLASSLDQPAMLAAEVRRVLAGAAVPVENLAGVVILPAPAASPAVRRDVMTRLGLQANSTYGDSSENSPANLASAMALEVSAAGARLNFHHSRLAEPPTRWLNRSRTGAIAAAAALLLIILFLAGDWYMQSLAVEDLREQLAAMKPQVASAKANVERMKLARGWFDNRPAILDGMRAVTLAFPTSGQAWTTSLTIREDLSGTLAGKAQSEKYAIELLDRMRSNKQFSDVKLLYLRQAERTSKVVAFALTFNYTGKE